MEARARAAEAPRGFARALAGAGGERVAVIAEVKRRSPSAGALRADADLASIAACYERGGARALSVLTDAAYFGGRDDDIDACRRATRLPLLRKDFLVDPYQIVESRALGADAVLLIVRALDGAALAALHSLAAEWGLDALVEAHDERELDAALALPAPAPIVGINNRDLATLATDLAVTERLAPRVPAGRVVVSESGIESAEDVRRVAAAGAGAILVGAALLRSGDPEAATRALARATWSA